MSRLQNWLNESNAAKMEEYIVDTWNGTLQTNETAQSVVNFLKEQGVTGKAVHLGSSSESITNIWKEYGGTDNTPKTDLMIGNYRISLKKSGGSQLMSGAKGETTATLYAVADKLGIQEQITKEMDDYLSKFSSGRFIDNLTTQKKKGNVAQELVDADKMHKEFTNKLKSYFESNPTFRNTVIHEAMSGELKFGSNSSARATHILVFDEKTLIHKWHTIDDSSFINEKAAGTKINVSFKSTSSTTKARGKTYSIFSTLRLLNEQSVNEFSVQGIKSFFSNKWNKIRNWVRSKISNLFAFLNIEASVNIGKVKF